uniref:Uncharacterized protein n=1 Tax=Caenorhabditis japonica TaxID=281687 RepID=A0A8R1DYW3_CAEJA
MVSNSTSQYLKTLIVADGVYYEYNSSTNTPAWFFYVGFLSVFFCLVTCFCWLLVAVITLARDKPCNHVVRDATVIVATVEEETESKPNPKESTNRSQRSSKKLNSRRSENDRSEGGRCAIEME